MAYANRSAALMHMHEYDASLDDIEEALNNGYPAELQYKLLERRAKCLLSTGRFPAATDACRAARLQCKTPATESRCHDGSQRARVAKNVEQMLVEAQAAARPTVNLLNYAGNNSDDMI